MAPSHWLESISPSRAEEATPERMNRVLRSRGDDCSSMLKSIGSSAEGHIYSLELQDRRARGQTTGGRDE